MRGREGGSEREGGRRGREGGRENRKLWAHQNQSVDKLFVGITTQSLPINLHY